MTYTVATLAVSPAFFDEVEKKLRAAGYEHAIVERRGDGTMIDMHGIALVRETTTDEKHDG